jgi:CMP-N-acetylneuraminic acid synthetase
MRLLTIIPARAGSKGVPGKNTKLLGDKPLITHTILAAQRQDSKTLWLIVRMIILIQLH